MRIPLVPIHTLSLKWQRAYAKRREHNMIHHGLREPVCSEEAHRHVSRLVWIEEQRKREKALQIPLFDVGPALKGKRRRTTFHEEAK